MVTNKRYGLKLLSEASTSEDLFDDKTHQHIAETLHDIIRSPNSEGLTVGLEGEWGSGKSTVVSILRNKLAHSDNVIYFYFDAWEHEGDPLRRIFLEALIDGILQITEAKKILNENDVKSLEKIKNKISNREKTVHTTTTRTATELGRGLAISAFIVPLGVAMVSGTVKETCFQLGGGPHWQFDIGALLAMAPFAVIANHCVKLKSLKEKIFDLKNWPLLQGDSIEDATQDISEDQERSSIEFERYFHDILQVIFSKKDDTKLIIVIDNLDRIDAEVSLKIWSTLQTFLQHRNPSSSNKAASYSKRIFVIVPYDVDGLEKLWSNNIDRKSNQIEKNSSCTKSFFDKCFQLRIEVPQLIITGWESFCQSCINKALVGGWNEDEKKDVLDILKYTRQSVNDIPTPRDIKTYINQVGLLRMHCNAEISTRSIAFFAVEKYLEFTKSKDMQQKLVDGIYPTPELKPFFNERIAAEISGILFGVSTEKGQQLLLEPVIEEVFTNKKIDQVRELLNIHDKAFWTVLEKHLRMQMNKIDKMLDYSFTIHKGLWEIFPEKCDEFIKYLKESANKIGVLAFPSQYNIEEYKSMFYLLDFNGYNLSDLWKYIFVALQAKMAEGTFNHKEGNKLLQALAACVKQRPSQYTLESLPLDIWAKWASADNEINTSNFYLIRPHDDIKSQIEKIIALGSPIPNNFYNLIQYLINANFKMGESLFKAIRKHIDTNPGPPHGDIASIEVLKILLLVSLHSEEYVKFIEPIIEGPYIYNLAFHLNSNGAAKYIALLLAKYNPTAFQSFQVQNPLENSNAGLTYAKAFWKNKDDKNAQFIWEMASSTNDFAFIWEMAKDKSNVLVSDIIKIAIKENYSIFFRFENALELMKVATVILDDDDALTNELTKCFIAHSQIENEVISTNELDITVYDFELNLLVKYSKNKELVKSMEEKLHSLSEQQWKNALKNNTFLTTIAIHINKKLSSLNLTNKLYDPLLAFLKDWISNKLSPPENQIPEIPDIILLLDNDFRVRLENRLSSYIIEVNYKASMSSVSNLLDHINIKKIIEEDKDNIQNIIEDSIKKPAVDDALRVLDVILSHQHGNDFKPDDRLAKILRENIKLLLHRSKEDADKDLVKRLASKFHIDISLQEGDILILTAKYGKDNEVKDVTNIIRRFVEETQQEPVTFNVTNEILGDDPLVGVPKELKITYSYLGNEQSITVQENDIVNIP